MTGNSGKSLKDLMSRLSYTFQNESLLEEALRHRSLGEVNNERLEFLGDAVLGFLLAYALYETHPQSKEGDMTRMRAGLVNSETLAQLAMDLGVGDCIRVGAGDRATGAFRASTLSDTFEAIVGAIYLDGGLDACQRCVMMWFAHHFGDLAQLTPPKDPKTRLQEWTQALKRPLPSYELTMKGPAHALTFYATCRVEGVDEVGVGESSSRRKAEQKAAEMILEKLDERQNRE